MFANAQAVDYAMTLGRALNCDVARSIFARKNYFYPDMPKDFQTTQYEEPTNENGHVVLADGTVIGVERAHIEEDTGKSTHLGGGGRIHDATATLVDYNRAGVPDILLATGVSDARMEEGSMRVDANVSVRPVGSDELRTRCEIKNINSLRSLGRAINYEARRHVDLWTNGESPNQETRHWDEDGGRTTPGRSKEDADDYRYFACPDLPPLEPTAEDIAAIDAAMPALPAARRASLAEVAGIEIAATTLTVERGLDQLVVDAISAGADASAAMKHADQNLSDGQGQLSVEAFAAIIAMESEGSLSSTQVKTVLAELVDKGGEPAAIAEAMGFEAMDTGELDGLLEQLIADNPDEWARFVEGDGKVQGFFVGQIMKASGADRERSNRSSCAVVVGGGPGRHCGRAPWRVLH